MITKKKKRIIRNNDTNLIGILPADIKVGNKGKIEQGFSSGKREKNIYLFIYKYINTHSQTNSHKLNYFSCSMVK